MKAGKAMVVSPHPDDMEIGMGGTVAKMIDGGAMVVSVVATDGRRSTSPKGLSEKELARLRMEEAKEAARILGVGEVIFLGLSDVKTPDNARKFKDEAKGLISRYSPQELYMPHPEIDKHPTHSLVARLLLETIGESHSIGRELEIWCYEVWTPFPLYDRIEDITPYAELKKKAVWAHKSQMEYKDYAQGILGLNRYRAVFDSFWGEAKARYAEVFTRLAL